MLSFPCFPFMMKINALRIRAQKETKPGDKTPPSFVLFHVNTIYVQLYNANTLDVFFCCFFSEEIYNKPIWCLPFNILGSWKKITPFKIIQKWIKVMHLFIKNHTNALFPVITLFDDFFIQWPIYLTTLNIGNSHPASTNTRDGILKGPWRYFFMRKTWKANVGF